MRRCQGNIPVGAKVDEEMRVFIEGEAERLGVSVSELLRRLFITYRESRNENTACEHCGGATVIELSYS